MRCAWVVTDHCQCLAQNFKPWQGPVVEDGGGSSSGFGCVLPLIDCMVTPRTTSAMRGPLGLSALRATWHVWIALLLLPPRGGFGQGHAGASIALKMFSMLQAALAANWCRTCPAAIGAVSPAAALS